ncbi:MAG TPA: 50S ribosomal protein L2, partial [Treponemataceae bacterium]|nr:50S ribosomal protein L2 [Treponemataceae bacterium]
MALKVFKPYTPGTRTRIDLSREEITADKPEKSLTRGKKSRGGRGAGGRTAVRHQGGGHKQKYREIDFKRNKYGI